MKKTIGIIGGVSWESTVLYYQLINQAVRDKFGGLNSAKLIINSLNYAPIVQLERESNWRAVTEILITAAQTLEKSGADFLLLGCNTLHKVAPAIEKSISIPFLHIADGAGEKFQKANIKKIGLLGTQFTMEEGFYADRLENKFGLQVIIPTLKEREAIDKIIYNELCVGIINLESKKLLKKTIQSMIQSGAEGTLLGCTELGIIIKPEDAPVAILDTTVLHAETAVSLLVL
jgi:aspartate racemase